MQVTENKGARHILIAKIRAFARIRRPFSDSYFGWLGSTRTIPGLQSLTTDRWPLITVLKRAIRKLEFLLSPISSTTSKFLIDNFQPIFALSAYSQLSHTVSQRPVIELAGAPPEVHPGSFAGAACAKAGVFPLSNRQTTEKLDFRLTALSSATSKFLIDNFHRDFSFLFIPFANPRCI